MKNLDDHTIFIALQRPRGCGAKLNDITKNNYEQNASKRIKGKLKDTQPCTSSEKYLLDKKPLLLKSLLKDEQILSCIMYAKKQKSNENKLALTIKLKDRYKIEKIDLQRRLFTESPLNEVSAITDIDEGYYNYLNGRYIQDRVPLFKCLKTIVNDLIRLKLEIGFKADAALNIDTNYKKELDVYKTSTSRCMQQVKYFEEFISEDYQNSMSFLNKWDELKIKLEDKVTELYDLANEQFTIMSRLMGLDYMYSLQQKYGRFLYYLSPPTWRSKNREFARSIEIEARGFDLGQSSDEDTFKVIFEKMQTECSGNLVPPVLYFSHPQDLMYIFEAIEKQQLHHFAYVTHLTLPKKRVTEGIKCLKDIMKHESAVLVNTIQRFENILKFSDERCTQLKNRFLTILNGLFYASIGAPDVLKLFVHLEFCYERVYGEKPINMDVVSMAKALEDFYMDYMRRLDEIHGKNVKQAVLQCLRTERGKLKRADYASRELRLFNRLQGQLWQAYSWESDKDIDAVASSVKRKSTRISTMKLQKPHINKQKKSLEEAEIEYLNLFTDWVEGEDPDEYIHRLDEQN